MTNKQLLIETLRKETPVFVKVLQAVPEDAADYQPDPKSRSAKSLATQLVVQGKTISMIVKTGVLDLSAAYEPEGAGIKDYPELARKNFEQAARDLEEASDEEFENGEAKMIEVGKEVWKAKKYDMAWTMFFDAIHHRGQLSAYLRPMGAKVPAIYGPSGDDTGGM